MDVRRRGEKGHIRAAKRTSAGSLTRNTWCPRACSAARVHHTSPSRSSWPAGVRRERERERITPVHTACTCTCQSGNLNVRRAKRDVRRCEPAGERWEDKHWRAFDRGPHVGHSGVKRGEEVVEPAENVEHVAPYLQSRTRRCFYVDDSRQYRDARAAPARRERPRPRKCGNQTEEAQAAVCSIMSRVRLPLDIPLCIEVHVVAQVAVVWSLSGGRVSSRCNCHTMQLRAVSPQKESHCSDSSEVCNQKNTGRQLFAPLLMPSRFRLNLILLSCFISIFYA